MLDPKIDKRLAGDIEKDIKDLVPAYLPNWKLEPGEPGWAVARVFSKMVEEILKRLNQVPKKLFLTFLDKLGTKISPPLPARAPITFYLAEGVSENVKVPAKVSIATKEQVNFETEKEFTATTAKLSALLSVDPDQDKVFDHSEEIQQGSPIVLFSGERDEGQHILYIGDDNLFNLNKGFGKDLYIELTVPFIENCVWQYWGKGEDGNEGWINFETKDNLHLYKQLTPPTSQKNINGHNTYWIRAVFKGACRKEIKINDLNIDYESKSGVDALFYNDVPIDVNILNNFYNDVPINVNILNNKDQFFYPFGPEPKLQDTFYIASNEAFSKKRLNIELEFTFTLPSFLILTLIENILNKLDQIKQDLINSKKIKVNKIEKIKKDLEGLETVDSILNKLEQLKKMEDVNSILSKLDQIKEDINQLKQTKPVELSWEYWDGKSWKSLSISEIQMDEYYHFPKRIPFECPKDILPTEVNGEKNHWIRVRLIGGGYGSYISKYDPQIRAYKVIPVFKPPKIKDISIRVNKKINKKKKVSPQYLIAYNNLEYKEFSNKIYNPCVPLSDKQKTIYLGFDSPFNEGLITIFFSLSKKYWEAKRYLEWSYYSKDGWRPLNVKDETNGLTQSGICEFIAPLDQDRCQKFNKELYWIKIELVEKIPAPIYPFYPLLSQIYPKEFVSIVAHKLLKNPVYATYLYQPKYNLSLIKNILKPFLHLDLYKTEEKTINIEPCAPDLIPFHPALHLSTEKRAHQIELMGIYLNTIWATQSETIEDEILGSSDGSPNQKFSLLRPPVIELKVWVKEPLLPEDSSTPYYKDEEGGFWILWKEVDDLQYSSPLSRHYALDHATGEIRFGDGRIGLIPPIGKDNIKATYKTGGGKKGNVAVGKIDTIVTPVAYVDKVKNHERASGGADIEDISNVLIRAPKRLKTRSRAITIEDYELLTKEASTEIAEVKVIPNLDNFGKYQPNWVTIIIVPESKASQPMPSKGLIKNVGDYIKERCPLTTHIQVIPPVYAKVDTDAVILIKKWELLSSIKKEVQEKIASFLHPLYGGIEGKGWEFGTIPCLSDFFFLLDKIPGVSYIKELKLTIRTFDQKLIITSDSSPVLDVSPYVLVCSGTHNIILEGE